MQTSEEQKKKLFQNTMNLYVVIVKYMESRFCSSPFCKYKESILKILIEYEDKVLSKLRNPMENWIQELNASPKLG